MDNDVLLHVTSQNVIWFCGEFFNVIEQDGKSYANVHGRLVTVKNGVADYSEIVAASRAHYAALHTAPKPEEKAS